MLPPIVSLSRTSRDHELSKGRQKKPQLAKLVLSGGMRGRLGEGQLMSRARFTEHPEWPVSDSLCESTLEAAVAAWQIPVALQMRTALVSRARAVGALRALAANGGVEVGGLG